MDATKIFLILIFFTPIFTFGQESKYPKDTIYIKYENKLGNKKLLNWNHNSKYGTSFSIKDISEKHISLFYEQNSKIDTLCLKHLKDYKFLNLKQIKKKEWEYYKKRFGGNPIISNKNWVFHTFLIEIISNDYFVIYPVMWRNEGY